MFSSSMALVSLAFQDCKCLSNSSKLKNCKWWQNRRMFIRLWKKNGFWKRFWDVFEKTGNWSIQKAPYLCFTTRTVHLQILKTISLLLVSHGEMWEGGSCWTGAWLKGLPSKLSHEPKGLSIKNNGLFLYT